MTHSRPLFRRRARGLRRGQPGWVTLPEPRGSLLHPRGRGDPVQRVPLVVVAFEDPAADAHGPHDPLAGGPARVDEPDPDLTPFQGRNGQTKKRKGGKRKRRKKSGKRE